jgi:hypothetical protein
MERLIRIWKEVSEELDIQCAAAHKRDLGTFVLALGIILALPLT